MAHIHFNHKTVFQTHQNWKEKLRSAKAQISAHFIVSYEDIKQPVEKMWKEVEEMKSTYNNYQAYREKNETWLKQCVPGFALVAEPMIGIFFYCLMPI